MASVVLVRYGTVPEVSRFRVEKAADRLSRGDAVLVHSHRGLQLGTVLSEVHAAAASRIAEVPAGQDVAPPDSTAELPPVVRRAAAADLETSQQLRQESAAAFNVWRERIARWQLELELIDLEWTLDRKKLVLYVLNERGPDCTKLALQAAAAGLGVIEVQPVSAEGLVALPAPSTGAGCGTCGCH
ncbi:MAG: PSP1 C-terminal domain-containing protein [Planctomycetaceae bacterium]